MSRATEDTLADLHGAIADKLKSLIAEGDVQAISQARQFLKDNGITVDAKSSSQMKSLADSLPDLPENVTPMYGGQ